MLVGVVGFLGSEVVLSPVVSGCLPSCGGWVLVGVVGFLGSEVVLSPVVSRCLPSCEGRVLVGVAASRTETFRDQNHRLQSKFAYCKLFGVYAGVMSFLLRDLPQRLALLFALLRTSGFAFVLALAILAIATFSPNANDRPSCHMLHFLVRCRM